MIDELAEYEQQMKMTKNATVERMKNMMNMKNTTNMR